MTSAGTPLDDFSQTPWQRALLAAVIHLVEPRGTSGIRLRAQAGVVRDAWLEAFAALMPPIAHLKRMPAQISDSRLLGGLDLAATLTAGGAVAEKGLLAEAHGGVILLAMAERIEPATAAKLIQVMDRGVVTTERDGLAFLNPARFGIVALDEGIEDEQPPTSLTDRLGLIVNLSELTHRDIENHGYTREQIAIAQTGIKAIAANDAMISAVCAASAALGIQGVRAPLQTIQAARALAALAKRSEILDEDLALAAALVLAPRATQMPASENQNSETPETSEQEPPPAEDNQEPVESEPPEQQPDQNQTPPQAAQPLEDIVVEAALASLPNGMLAALRNAGTSPPTRLNGKSGMMQKQATRGRQIGSKLGDFRSKARLDVIATLRHAAPWQRLRQNPNLSSGRIKIRKEDIHIARYRQRAQTTTIFVVDASGSSALQRLAEAKGAVRLLLSESYVRRDEVALIAFRGTTADVILPPTRSLVRAQRALTALPGGGGTPIATAIDRAIDLAVTVQRSGRTPSIVIMTDGRANVQRNGSGGRTEAQNEARTAAKMLRRTGHSIILIDTSPKPQPLASELAELMGARYVPLPHANAENVALAVQAHETQTPAKNPLFRGAA
jgi:magnesium chelatase subunit D